MSNKEPNRNNHPILIDNLTKFNQWRSRLRTFNYPGDLNRYQLELPELTPTENQNLSDLVNRYSSECGCNSGSIFMSLLFMLTVAAYFVTGGTISAIGFHQLGWLASITFGAAVTGKIFGLLRAKWSIISLTNQVSQTIAHRYPQQSIQIN